MTAALDDIESQHLRAQIRLSARSGLGAAAGALLVSIVISGDTTLDVGAVTTAFAILTLVIAGAFVTVTVAERRLSDRWAPLLYGVSSWVMLQAVIGISNQFPGLALIGPVLMGILPVAIALFGRWRPIHQVAWCVTCLIPMAISVFLPIGDSLWPETTRISTVEAFAIGSFLSITGIRVLDEARRLVREQRDLIVDAHDAERHALDEMRRSESLYRGIVELSKEGVWVADVDGRTTLANGPATEILGYRPGDLIGRNMLEALDPEVLARIRPYLGTDPPAEPLGDIQARRADGSTVWLSVAATRLRDDAGEPFGTMAMFNDVSHRHQLEQDLRASNMELDRLAYLDGLTGLRNRRALDSEIEEHAGSRRQVGILMMDIDHFKRFNDDNGHPAGDRALVAVAGALTSALRPDDKVYRYGGEEFLIIVERATDQQAMVVAERARSAVTALRLPRSASQPNLPLTISIGVATGQPAQVPMRALIAAADGALYQAKSRGRDRVELAGAAAVPRGETRPHAAPPSRVAS